jgi:hypothetical protein
MQRGEGIDSIARAMKADNAFIDLVKKEATRIEAGFVAIDHRTGTSWRWWAGRTTRISSMGSTT